MTGMRLQRFDMQHLRDFRKPITVNAAVLEDTVQEELIAPPAPVFAEVDLELARVAAKKIGYAEGFEAGLAQAASEQTAREKDIAFATGEMRRKLDELAETHQQLVDVQATELSELVLMIARKVAGEALEANAIETISALLKRCLPVIFGKPRVMLELHPDMLEKAQPVLTKQLVSVGFEGEISFTANPELAVHDLRIEWNQGEATRSTAQLWQEIEALLQQVTLTPTLPTTEETTHG